MHKKTVIDFKELGVRQIFTQPLKELKTRQLSEVKELIKEVEAYQQQGYYVVGYVSYEAAPAFDEAFQVHQGPVFQEYLLYFTVHDQVETQPFPLSYEPVSMPAEWQNLTTETEYQQAIATIQQHIRQGNTYQVNYTVQLAQELTANSMAVYNRLVIEQNANYNAYIAHDDNVIISFSPELFFKREGGYLITRPMKGTTKRGNRPDTDLAEANWLAQDPKNRAENMMIVDLLRNDMNRIAQNNTEDIDLCHIEQYSTVWQMTSTIKMALQADTHLVDIFTALFPCGSITGAPKIATMAIIKTIEKQARGVYCGAIGLLLPNGPSIFNVAIRTIQLQGQKAIYGVGGGITWDSQWQSEYQETKQKAAVLYRQNPQFDLISTGRLHRGQLNFLEEHVQRFRDSSRYFAFPFDEKELRASIAQACQKASLDQDYRLRIALSKNGQFNLEMTELMPLSPTFSSARLVQQHMVLDSPFTYFKTSYRPHLTIGEQEQIYYNTNGQLLETSIGNLVIEHQGQLYTPPIELGILNGIYRQVLLKDQKVKVKTLTLADLKQADKIYACNAVRGLYPLTIAVDLNSL